MRFSAIAFFLAVAGFAAANPLEARQEIACSATNAHQTKATSAVEQLETKCEVTDFCEFK
ncbi:hypothetical protein PM082_018038 [Marasmius tenuissimus]|nr:hypothetical protein PM082_018038 [Marasmius tenuissimus]